MEYPERLTHLRHSPAIRAVILGLATVLAGCSPSKAPPPQSGSPASKLVDAATANNTEPGELKILYPWEGAMFPPDIAAPTFRWEDGHPGCDVWSIGFRFRNGDPLEFHSDSREWTPPDEDWQTIKNRSVDAPVEVAIRGVSHRDPNRPITQGAVSIRTSQDPVEAPLFFREVNLPFRNAVKNPAAYIRWRFGPVSSKEPPPVVLEKLPVCGNCHSFSADGSILGMDVDYANDKGSYLVAEVAPEIPIDKSNIFTWSDYDTENGTPTFGLLSQVSPDGRYVVSTVKDRSVFVAVDNLAFSQLFFPVKGILAVYDRQNRQIRALPGADDERFVQSNATWSPDGETIVFARAEAYALKNLLRDDGILLSESECEEFLKGGETFQFDLYRIPFNDGRGGKPEPVEGASHNGMSNYFPKFSPDGKWIVFCKAKSFMLLQPDSELYILSAQGGEARRLECNTAQMNSWHSWSPNGKWLVFSSKPFSPYTQLLLTHIDPEGRSSVPVVLSRFTEPERAANIPEFVNTSPDGIWKMTESFLDDHNYFRAGKAFADQGDRAAAADLYRKALNLNPAHVDAHLALALILLETGKMEESLSHWTEAARLRPQDVIAQHYSGHALYRQGKTEEAVAYYRRALQIDPGFVPALLDLASVRMTPGKEYSNIEEALTLATKACEVTRRQDPLSLKTLAGVYALSGRFGDAATMAREALRIARDSNETYLVQSIEKMLKVYEEHAARTQK